MRTGTGSTTTRRAATAALAVAALLLPSCASDDAGDAASTTVAPANDTTTTDAPADDGHDHAHDEDMPADHDGMTAEEHAAMGDDLGLASLTNGHEHDTGDEPEPLTAEEEAARGELLAVTEEVHDLYPTIADAEAAGWTRQGPFSPGLGTHYGPPDYHLNTDGVMDAEDMRHPMLVFDGLGPDAKLAGFMYLVISEDVPEGFPGEEDTWHYHEKVCLVPRPDGGVDSPFGADLEGVTAEMCTEVGGNFLDFTGYMVHVWAVPGYESPRGMFSDINPAITCPDGSYWMVPTMELGTRDSACRDA